MKRILIFLLVSCACLLAACDRTNNVSGKIVEVNLDDGIGVVSFVVRTNKDEEIGILMTEGSFVFSFVDGLSAENFKTGTLTDVIVSVDCDTSRRSLITQDGNKINAYNANQIELTGYLKTDALTLEDGTNVDVWQRSDAAAYTLQNGIELLIIQNPTGPDNVYVGGVESFGDLGETAQNNVLEFYISQGLLYDEQLELEKAYANYLKAGENSEFDSYMIGQDTAPAASSNTVMYFLTSVLLPADAYHYEYRIGAAFDKATGAHIDNRELFSCPPDEIIQTILDIAGITDPVLREEMEQAFDPERIILFPENLEICFPQGALPSQEYSYMIGLDYDARLLEILNEWAVPTSRK